jgi:hypothetical protein
MRGGLSHEGPPFYVRRPLFMNAVAQDLRPAAAHSRPRALLDLLSSMRFSISLLTVICIASIIGTVLKQASRWATM